MSITLDWQLVNLDGTTSLKDGDTEIDVTVSTPLNEEDQPKEWALDSAEGATGSFNPDSDPILSFGVGAPTRLDVAFGREVTDLTFEIYDVDQGPLPGGGWDDRVKVIAKNAEGDAVEVRFSDLNATHRVDGASAPGGNATGTVLDADGNDDPGLQGPGAPDSVSVHIAGPVASIEIVHVNGTAFDDAGAVALSDWRFQPVPPCDEDPERDGIVSGTDGADRIAPGVYTDVDGDEVDANDAIIPGDKPNDDRIFGMGGDDTIVGGKQDDTIDGGTGDDRIAGGRGRDSILGGDGDDTIVAGTVGLDDRPDIGYVPILDDRFPDNDRDFVDGGAGDDLISTGDDRDTIIAGAGDDTVRAGFDDDEVSGNAGDDVIVAGEGNDTVLGGAGDDTIFGGTGNPDSPLNIVDDGDGFLAPDLQPGNGRDLLDGGEGDDEIYGADDDDTLIGGDGDDLLDGGVDDDVLLGGDGDDTIEGGQGDDTITGGRGGDRLSGGDDDRDLFLYEGAEDGDGDIVIGGAFGDGGTDRDEIRIEGVLGVDYRVVDTVQDSDGNGLDGRVEFLDGDIVTGELRFENIEIVCFTPGTRIATPKGERLVEDLTAGDRVLTRDNGVREIAWYGQSGLNAADFAARPRLAPVRIKAGALGGGLPLRDMLVSPQHRILVASEKAAYYFDEREVLVPALHLINGTTIVRQPVPHTTYIHFMCETHEVVLSDGAWTESFQPGDYSLRGIASAQRDEILELFPSLADEAGLKGYTAARRTLTRKEAVLLAR